MLENNASPRINPKPLADTGWADLQEQFDVQVRGAFALMQPLCSHLICASECIENLRTAEHLLHDVTSWFGTPKSCCAQQKTREPKQGRFPIHDMGEVQKTLTLSDAPTRTRDCNRDATGAFAGAKVGAIKLSKISVICS